MPRIGPTELIIILVIILIVFGAGRLPEIGGAIGKGLRSFKRSSAGEDEGPGDAKARATTKETEQKSKS